MNYLAISYLQSIKYSNEQSWNSVAEFQTYRYNRQKWKYNLEIIVKVDDYDLNIKQ